MTQVKLFFTQSATPVPIVVVQLAEREELDKSNNPRAASLFLSLSFLAEQLKKESVMNINISFIPNSLSQVEKNSQLIYSKIRNKIYAAFILYKSISNCSHEILEF